MTTHLIASFYGHMLVGSCMRGCSISNVMCMLYGVVIVTNDVE